MLRETLPTLGLLACVAACTPPTTTTNTSEPTPAPPASGTGARSDDPKPPAATTAAEAQPAASTTFAAETLVGRRYWADPQRAGWTYEVDLCPGQRAIERNTGTNIEGKYELHGTELVITFADRVARFQFPSGAAFMLGTNKLGRAQKLEHKGESDCAQ
jgi:hypothetical protein